MEGDLLSLNLSTLTYEQFQHLQECSKLIPNLKGLCPAIEVQRIKQDQTEQEQTEQEPTEQEQTEKEQTEKEQTEKEQIEKEQTEKEQIGQTVYASFPIDV